MPFSFFLISPLLGEPSRLSPPQGRSLLPPFFCSEDPHFLQIIRNGSNPPPAPFPCQLTHPEWLPSAPLSYSHILCVQVESLLMLADGEMGRADYDERAMIVGFFK
jgi:hypothetical protein